VALLPTVTVSLPLAKTNPEVLKPTTLPPTVNVWLATEGVAAEWSLLEHPGMNTAAARAKKAAATGDDRWMLVSRMLRNPHRRQVFEFCA
jgi:hypothetical protein